MKIDEYAPIATPMNIANAKSFSVSAAEEQQRQDRQQHDERRVHRAHQHLVQRVVDDSVVPEPATTIADVSVFSLILS